MLRMLLKRGALLLGVIGMGTCLVACIRERTTHANTSPRFADFLVTQVSREAFETVAVGDGLYVWAWKPGSQGVFLIDQLGNVVNRNAPFLPKTEVKGIFALGDHIHGVVAPVA